MPAVHRRFVPAILASLTALLVLFPAVLLASAGAAGERAPIGETLWSMGVKVVDFAIVAWLLFHFLSKPLTSYLATRAETMRAAHDELKRRRDSEEQAKLALEASLRGIEEEVRKLKEEARLEMERERQQIMAEAHRAAQELIRHTQETVKREFAKARAELYSSAVDSALALAEELIAKNIGEKDQRRFAEDYIKRISPDL